MDETGFPWADQSCGEWQRISRPTWHWCRGYRWRRRVYYTMPDPLGNHLFRTTKWEYATDVEHATVVLGERYA